MGRYNANYDVMGEPLSILPRRDRVAAVSDGEVHAVIEKQLQDVVEQECAFLLSQDDRPDLGET